MERALQNVEARERFGAGIARARRESGLSQQRLADRCGLAQSTISRIETGDVNGLRYATLMRIMDALSMVEVRIVRAPQGIFAQLVARYDVDAHELPGLDRENAVDIAVAIGSDRSLSRRRSA